MNLMKWFRKNNKRIMAVVVIVIMIGFIGDTYIRQIGQQRTGLHSTTAYFGKNKSITNFDLASARQELEILRILRADYLLKGMSLPLVRTPDFRSLLLGELLFSDRNVSPALINRMKQMIRIQGYAISDKQINDIYKNSGENHLYWLLLNKEAEQAGIVVSSDSAGKQLSRVVPQMFNGVTYSQLISSLVSQQGVSEREILTTFGKLLAVVEYAKIMCATDDVTTSQIRLAVSRENETLNMELMKFESDVFAENQGEPAEQQIVEQFDKYKKFFAGTVSEENPYGFGYKLPDMVRLEYIAVRLDDVSGIVTPLTQEEVEEFYQRNREQLVEQVPSDPNDPNSAPTERTKTYTETASAISEQLLRSKIDSQAENILLEARTLSEAGFENAGVEAENLTAEQYQLIAKAANYQAIADQLTEKHKIKVYSGQTGLLSAADIQTDKYLGMLHLGGYGSNFVRLPGVVFAIDELQSAELGPFDVAKPRMYENIGPLKDLSRQSMVVARIVEARKASEPESITQAFGKDTLVFNDDQKPAGEKIYSIKDIVAKDLKKLAAMNTTKSKAEEFIALAAKGGWDNALDKFNQLYGSQAEADRKVFDLYNLKDVKRVSRMQLAALAAQIEGNPADQFVVDQRKNDGQLIDQLYSLIPQDSNSVAAVPLLVESKPEMSFYCVKSLSVKRLNEGEYEKNRTLEVYKENIVESQGLAAVHFGPENIMKRMNFKWADKTNAAEAKTEAEAESKGKP